MTPFQEVFCNRIKTKPRNDNQNKYKPMDFIKSQYGRLTV